MWIWKDQYNQLQRLCSFWKDEYRNLYGSTKDLQLTVTNLTEQIESLKAGNEELQEYKQKYVDEVQKRLELIKLIENAS